MRKAVTCAAIKAKNERKESYMNMKAEYECQSWMKRNQHGIRGTLALLFLLPLDAWSGGVVTNCTEADLRAAMAGGGVVTFACDGTITLGSAITNDADLMLDATGHAITIRGNNAVRVFNVNTNVNFTVSNLTIADAKSQGGSAILNLGGALNLSGVLFRSNTATITEYGYQLIPQASGGAIYNRGGIVHAANCSFVGNAASIPSAAGNVFYYKVNGGAIRNESGQVDLRSCSFVGNRASGGAGVSPGGGLSGIGDPASGGAIHNSGTMTVDLCTFTSNSATGGEGFGWQPATPGYPGYPGGEGCGGAILNQGAMMVDRSTLSLNTAKGGSGGRGGFGTDTTTTLAGGDGGGASGAAIRNQGTLTVDRTTLWGNAAAGGNGGLGGTGTSSMNGYPGGSGGSATGAALCNLNASLVARSTMVSNVVTGGAGGAGGSGWETLDVGGDGAPGGNAGSGLGGAMAGGGTLVNCTIAFNTGSGGNGGAGGNGGRDRYASSGGAGRNGGSGLGGVEAACTNCTVVWNRGQGGSGGAGGLSYGYGSPGAPGTNGIAWGGTAGGTLVNTLIASNTPAGGDSFTDPKLGPLADNGGPTLTMALLPGSPAIDAGSTALAPVTDQRGFPRPAGSAADIGAFEYGSVMPTIAASRLGADGVNLLGNGNTGQVCRLLGSADMANWIPLATNQIGMNGTVVFYDTCSGGGACRFYRLVMP
jgi:hypothetical protein